jgi:hypothetical protein
MLPLDTTRFYLIVGDLEIFGVLNWLGWILVSYAISNLQRQNRQQGNEIALPQRALPPLIPRPLASYGQKQSTRKRPVFPRSSSHASNKSDSGKGKALGYSRAEHGHRRRCGSSSGGGPLKKMLSSARPRLATENCC